MASNSWRPPRPCAEEPSRKRPFSPHESPSRNIRLRNAIHRDLLFEQGTLPLFATFSSRGSRAICCFRNGFARVWNVDPVHNRFLDCEQVLRHPSSVFRAAISDDGTRAITTAGDGIARVWDLQSPQPRCREISSHFRSTRTCDISTDGQFVAATFYTGKRIPVSTFRGLIVLYDPARDDYLFRITVAGVPDKIKVSRDAITIAVGCYGVKPAQKMARKSRLTIFNRDGTEIAAFEKCFTSHDSCVAWDLSEDGLVLAICAQNRTVIQVYSNRDERTWKDPPLLLSANAELTYEMCRIVDNGDLITALVLDNKTEERSVIVFRPSSRNVLFSLASGLMGPKACLDLEPRVCYVAPRNDRSGRKVMRLLTRTLDESGKLDLVRCGDPPKNALHGPSTSFDSSTPFSAHDNPGIPANSIHSLNSDNPVSLARKMRDNPTPKPPKPMDWTPARDSKQPLITTSLPQNDSFKLRKAVPKDGIDECSSPLRSSLVNSPSPSSTKPTLEKQIPVKLVPDVSTKDVANASKHGYASNASDSCSKGASRSVQMSAQVQHTSANIPQTSEGEQRASEKVQEPAETVPSPKSTVITPHEVNPAKEEASCKPTAASKSKLSTIPVPEQSITPKNAKASASKQPEEAIVHTAPRDTGDQALSNNQLTASKHNNEKNEETKISAPETKAAEKVNENIDEAKRATAITGHTDKDIETSGAPVLSIKKPRWQPVRLRARKKMLENAALKSKAEHATLASTGQEDIERGELSLSCGPEKKLLQETGLNGRTGGKTDIPESSRAPESESPCPQKAGMFSSPETQGSGDKKGPSNTSGGTANVGKTIVVCPVVSNISNPVTSLSHGLVRTPESRARNAGDNEKIGHHTLHGLKSEEMVDAKLGIHFLSGGFSRISQEKALGDATAKQEAVLGPSHVKVSPTAMTSLTSTQVNPNEGSSPKLKENTNGSLSNNKYDEALERARAMFRGASHKLEGGAHVLSNVKAFKTMLEVIGAESEVVDRRIVARIVYEKGGINNTLDEKLFLEVFAHLYQEMQGIRQRQWVEVYNQASAGEGEGLLVFHARDLIKQESKTLSAGLNPIWNDESLDELIASQTADGVLVDQTAFVDSIDKIFSI